MELKRGMVIGCNSREMPPLLKEKKVYEFTYDYQGMDEVHISVSFLPGGKAIFRRVIGGKHLNISVDLDDLLCFFNEYPYKVKF